MSDVKTPPAVSTKPGMYRAIDAFRGMAALWVVLHHATGFFIPMHPELQNNPLYMFFLYGAWGVWMFFVISGYCIANAACQAMNREKPFQYYMWARLHRIFPPYWISTVFYFLASAGAAFLVGHHIIKSSSLADVDVLHKTWLFYVTNLTLTQRLLNQGFLSGVYWTLCYEILFYVIVGCGLAITMRKQGATGMLSLMHIVTAISMAMLLFASRYASYFYPLDCWAHFGIGVLVYDLIRYPRRREAMIGFAIVAAEVALYAFLHHEFHDYLDRPGGRSYLFSILFAGGLLLLHRYDAKISSNIIVRGLAWVGQFAYSLYLIHLLAISIVWSVLSRTGIAHRFPLAYVFCTVVAALVAGWVFHILFEKPFLNSSAKKRVAPAEPKVSVQEPSAVIVAD